MVYIWLFECWAVMHLRAGLKEASWLGKNKQYHRTFLMQQKTVFKKCLVICVIVTIAIVV